MAQQKGAKPATAGGEPASKSDQLGGEVEFQGTPDPVHNQAAALITWEWRPGPLDARVRPAEPRPHDCLCLLYCASQMALGLLEGHVKPPTITGMIEDCVRLALGPGRIACIELISPRRPAWLPS